MGRNAREKPFGLDIGDAVVHVLIGNQLWIRPDGFSVLAPKAIQGPTRQLLARVPLALAEVRKTVRRIALLQPVVQVRRVAALRGSKRGRVPLVTVRIVDRDEGRLTAHREPHVLSREVGIDDLAERIDRAPLSVCIRLGHARRFPDASHAHLMLELGLAFVDGARDRRRLRRLRRTGERNMPLSGEQTGGRVETDPAGTGQIHLAPGV